MANDAPILVTMPLLSSDCNVGLTKNGMSRSVGSALDAGDNGTIGWRSFAVSVKSPSHSLSSNRMGAFLLRDSAGSPTPIAAALLVTFVQNRYNCSSPWIPLSLHSHRRHLLTFVAHATCNAEYSSSCWRVSAVSRSE